jgi:uncharacterized protein with GYD domain
MATYIMLSNFTDQGIHKVKDSTKRADDFKNAAKKVGATMKDLRLGWQMHGPRKAATMR